MILANPIEVVFLCEQSKHLIVRIALGKGRIGSLKAELAPLKHFEAISNLATYRQRIDIVRPNRYLLSIELLIWKP